MENLVNLGRVLAKFAKEFQIEYKELLSSEGINSSFKLSNSIEVVVIEKENASYQVVFRGEDYYMDIENGRDAGLKAPSEDSILQWVNIKPIIPYPNDKGVIPTPQQLAFLISRSIGRKGIEPKPLLQTLLDNLFSKYQEEIIEAVRLDVKTAITATIKENEINKTINFKI